MRSSNVVIGTPCATRPHDVRLRPHQPYFQSVEVNEYGGGIQRDVAPLTRSTLDTPLLKSLTAVRGFPLDANHAADGWISYEIGCI